MSLLTAIIAAFHFNFFIRNGSVVLVGFVLVLVYMIWKSGKVKVVHEVKHFQYKTLSILSFLLPVSAIIYTLIFTGTAVSNSGNEYEQAGSAIGGLIGGGIVTFFAFVVGLSLGITFHILSKKSSK